jgi:hypothetical protein
VAGTFAAKPPVIPPPAGLALPQRVRFNNSSIDHTNTTAPSAEIRPDRTITDVLLLTYGATGGFVAEWSSHNFDELIEAALCGKWDAAVGVLGNLQNGVIFRSFVLEQGYLDIARFIIYRGMVIEEWDLNITARAIINETFTFMGVSGLIQTASLFTTAPAEPNLLTPITAGPAVTGVEMNPAIGGACVRSLKFKVKNNHRVRDCVESYESGIFGQGAQDITGTMEIFFANETIFQTMLNNAAIALTWQIIDLQSGGITYTFTLPKVKIETTAQPITGNNTDIIQTVSWRALLDATSGYQMKITRAIPATLLKAGEAEAEADTGKKKTTKK